MTNPLETKGAIPAENPRQPTEEEIAAQDLKEVKQIYLRALEIANEARQLDESAQTRARIDALEKESQDLVMQAEQKMRVFQNLLDTSDPDVRASLPAEKENLMSEIAQSRQLTEEATPSQADLPGESRPEVEDAEPQQEAESREPLTYQEAIEIYQTAHDRMEATSLSADALTKRLQTKMKEAGKVLKAIGGAEALSMSKTELQEHIAEKQRQAVEAIRNTIIQTSGPEVARLMDSYFDGISERLFKNSSVWNEKKRTFDVIAFDWKEEFARFDTQLEKARQQAAKGGMEAELETAKEQAKASKWKAFMSKIPYFGDVDYLQAEIRWNNIVVHDQIEDLRATIKQGNDAAFAYETLNAARESLDTIEQQQKLDAGIKGPMMKAEKAYASVETSEKKLQAYVARILQPHEYAVVKQSLPEQLPLQFSIRQSQRDEYERLYQQREQAKEMFAQTINSFADQIPQPFAVREAKQKAKEREESASRAEIGQNVMEARNILLATWPANTESLLNNAATEVFGEMTKDDESALQPIFEKTRAQLQQLQAEMNEAQTLDSVSDALEKRDATIEQFREELQKTREELRQQNQDFTMAKEALVAHWQDNLERVLPEKRAYTDEAKALAASYKSLGEELRASTSAEQVSAILKRRDSLLDQIKTALLDQTRHFAETPAQDEFAGVKQHMLNRWDGYVARALKRALKETTYANPETDVVSLLQRSETPQAKALLHELDRLKNLAEQAENEAAFNLALNERDRAIQSVTPILEDALYRTPEDLFALKDDYWRNWDNDTISSYKMAFEIDRLARVSVDTLRAQVSPENRPLLDSIFIGLRKEMRNARTGDEVSRIVNQRELLLTELKEKEDERNAEPLQAKVAKATENQDLLGVDFSQADQRKQPGRGEAEQQESTDFTTQKTEVLKDWDENIDADLRAIIKDSYEALTPEQRDFFDSLKPKQRVMYYLRQIFGGDMMGMYGNALADTKLRLQAAANEEMMTSIINEKDQFLKRIRDLARRRAAA